MDRHIRNEQQITIGIKQSGYDRPVFPHKDSARHAERTVKPRAVDHPSVSLHIEPQILARSIQLRLIFDLIRGRITVRCAQLKMIIRQLRAHAECDNARSIARRIIAAARTKLPVRRLRQIGKACLFQPPRNLMYRMKGAGTPLNKCQ